MSRKPDARPEDIAVVGAGCRFPGGVRDLDGLWRVLLDGVDTVRPVPADRWDDSFHDSDPKSPGTTYCREGGFLTDIDRFDADHFGISPREAREMDPQQRLLLEVAAEAMEDAGVPRARWEGTRTSVHLGILASDYLLLHTKTNGTESIDPYFAGGKEFSFAAGRIAYTFGLQGPCMTVNTACSSSLVAVHLACQALRSGETDAALAGGVNVMVTPELTVFMGKVQALSPTGRCKPFDARADGIVRGEGCGIVVLKRYADALRDQDQIYGIIRGSAVNQDGRSAGLTAPNALAQQALLRDALAAADLGPGAPAYVEAHGTGTPLGDPLEISALAEVYGAGRTEEQRLLVGSHKANFGHMDSAAGIAGLLKTLLVLRHRTVPPQINHTYPSPMVDWDATGISVPTEPVRLPGPDEPLVAGVSAFGLSGTNAHVLLSAPPAPSATEHTGSLEDGGPGTLVLSASTAAGLGELAADYRRFLAGEPNWRGAHPATAGEVLAAAAVRRTHLRHRLAVTGEGAAELAAGLEAFTAGRRHASYAVGEAAGKQAPVAYVFSGQGSQWPGMGMDLYGTQPLVRETLEEIDALVAEHAGWSLVDALRDEDPERLRATEAAQPAVFAVQVALARLWRSWGVLPDAVIGHSMGEVAAACVAGALPLADATRLIVHRGRLLQQATGTGRMAAVELGADETRERLALRHPEVRVATVNGPASVVVAGPADAVEAAVADLSGSGVQVIGMPVDYAFHHPLVRPYGDELERIVADLRPAEPVIPFLPTAVPHPDAGALDAAYWGANLREPVLFWPAVDRFLAGLSGRQDAVFVEIGAHPVLARPLQAALGYRERGGPVVGSLARGRAGRLTLAQARARLHVAGVPVQWSAVHPGAVGSATLPPPRWADERHWLSGVARGTQSAPRFSPKDLRAELRLYDDRGRLVGELAGSPMAAGAADSPGGVAAADARQAPPAVAVPAPAGSAGGSGAPGAVQGGPHAPAPAGAAPSAPAEAVPPPALGRRQVANAVQRTLAVVLGHEPGRIFEPDRGFFELGLDSISIQEAARRIAEELGVELDAADALTHASVESLTDFVLTLRPEAKPVPAPAPVVQQAPAAQPPGRQGPEPVAIVGIGCRLPGGVDGPESFWQLLQGRTDASGPVPGRRWDAQAILGDGTTPGTAATARGSFLEAVDGFDHGFFRISPKEARSMDPQQRLFLEVAWESLEDAGLRAERLRGTRTGVFVGLNTTDYQQLVTRERTDVDLYYGTGNSFSGTAGRLSYFLGLRGPSIAVDTACSSSLTAIHLACQSLRTGESEVAVAGGANVMSTPTVFLAMSQAGALAPDGRCKTFDDSADGYGRGEGAGAVVLKTLSSALRDGDRVYALIRGSAVNQDGASGGLTVPSGEAQEDVIRTALSQARIEPGRVGYVEAHGTGTRLGDAIELRALAGALGEGRQPGRPLLVGSVKTNVGHLEAAAGVTGLIKTVLALGHQEIPAHLHVTSPTRQVAWDRLPLRVATTPTRWPRGEQPRFAGVSAFGFTGTNAHVLVEEAPAPAPAGASASERPLVLTGSALTPAALSTVAHRLRERVAGAPATELADLCWVSGARRSHHEHRFAVVGRTRRELTDGLMAAARAEAPDGVRLGTARKGEHRPVALCYGGSCALPADRDDPAFRAALAEVDAAVAGVLGFSPAAASASGELPERGSVQEKAFTLASQLAMTALWTDLGVVPEAVVGHESGEFAAAVVAGELTVAEAVRLIAAGHDAVPAGAVAGELPRYSAGAGWSALAARLAAEGVGAVLDAGGGGEALRPLRGAIEGLDADIVVPTAQRPVEAAAALHAHGARIDWDRLVPGGGRVVSLPGYPWQRTSHWIGPVDEPAPPAVTAPAAQAPAPAGEQPLVAELRSLSGEAREERLLDTLLDLVGEVLGESGDIAPDQGFFDLGMDSVLSAQLKRGAERQLGVELPGTILFECPNARSFTRFVLDELFGEEPAMAAAQEPGPEAEPADAPDAPDALDDLSDDALMSRLLSALTSSESLLTEGERP